MTYQSADGRLTFADPQDRNAHDRAYAAANAKRGDKPAPGQTFADWNRAWTATYAGVRNG